MGNRITGTFAEDSFTNAITTIADFVDASFGIGTPTQMTVNVEISVVATDNGNSFTYTFNMTFHVYHATTVQDKVGTNLDAVMTEWEDIITDSGKYVNIASGAVSGSVSVVVAE